MNYDGSVPIQYQQSKTQFMGMDIFVDSRVLIPRPETELLVTTVANICRNKSWRNPYILDIGTGSGVIPLGLVKLLNNCRVVGSDVSKDALNVARENIRRFDKEDKITLTVSDMFSALGSDYNEAFHCIVSNPPYVSEVDYGKLDEWVRAEPKIALYGGKQGMDYLDIIAGESRRLLVPGGLVAIEVGYDQSEKVKSGLHENGFTNVTSFKDFNNYERVIIGWKHG